MFKKLLRKLLLLFDSITNRSDFVVVSNNCFGAEVYRRLNKPYNTPFVGLFIMADDYIRLLENFDLYMNKELKFKDYQIAGVQDKIKNYPIGILGDLEIHFMHYKSLIEAKNKWERRTRRMLKTNAKKFFIFNDRDGATEEHFRLFEDLKLDNKISFSVNKSMGNSSTIIIKQSGRAGDTVPDGVSLYNICFQYLDYYYWLKSGVIKHSVIKKLRSKLRLI